MTATLRAATCRLDDFRAVVERGTDPDDYPNAAHRDYHLGFQDAAVIERFPAHVYALSSSTRRCSTPPGANRSSDIQPAADLVGVRPGDGKRRPVAMCLAVYAALLGMPYERAVANVIAATAEGYAFPTNLDNDPPLDGRVVGPERPGRPGLSRPSPTRPTARPGPDLPRAVEVCSHQREQTSTARRSMRRPVSRGTG